LGKPRCEVSGAQLWIISCTFLTIQPVLSGRTNDQNVGYIAEYLTAVGIDLKEVRVAGDEERAIVDALNALQHHYTHVFTTGGIGPNTNVVLRARDAQKLAQAKREVEEMLERVRRAQSNSA